MDNYRRVRAIIFDFDGVVVDSEPLYQIAERQLFKEYGVEVPPEDWKYFKGTTEEVFYTMVQERYGVRATLPELRARGRELLKQVFANQLNYYPGFLEFYEKYHPLFKMGLVTSTPAEFLYWVFGHTNIRNHFEEIVTADDVVHPKPHPEPYYLMLQRLQVNPAKAIIIEDSINGLTAAVASGAVTIALLSSLSASDIPPSVYPANSYQEIETIIKHLMP